MRATEHLLIFVGVFCMTTLVIKGCDTAYDIGRDEWFRGQEHENEKCALRGLVLLRGQLGEYVCVVPGSERGRRKP